jgi:hypothetical protein
MAAARVRQLCIHCVGGADQYRNECFAFILTIGSRDKEGHEDLTVNWNKEQYLNFNASRLQ